MVQIDRPLAQGLRLLVQGTRAVSQKIEGNFGMIIQRLLALRSARNQPLIERLLESGIQSFVLAGGGPGLAQRESLEAGLGVAELADAYLTASKRLVLHPHDFCAVYKAYDGDFIDDHTQVVPIARPVVGYRQVRENIPRENVRPSEVREADLAATGIESVMPILPVCSKDQASSTSFVV